MNKDVQIPQDSYARIPYHAAVKLSGAVDQLLEAADMPAANKRQKSQAVMGAMHDLCSEISSAQPCIPDQLIRATIRPAYDLLSESPFIYRLQTWPRGYTGDFQTIEALMSGRPSLDVSARAYWAEYYALNAPIAYQHRNKLNFQSTRCADGLAPGSSIMSVGCGGALDLWEMRLMAPESLRVTLVDIDRDALELATERVSWCDSVETRHGDPVSALRRLDQRFDRIVFGGLFDYLDDRVICLLLKLAYRRLLKENGRIIFSNVSNDIYATLIEYLADWKIRYRDERQINRILDDAEILQSQRSVCWDQTGLSLLCEIDKVPCMQKEPLE